MSTGKIAYVLGGGGQMGAHEVGMLRALIERGVIPQLIVGTSIGAINGAAIAAKPTRTGVERLIEVWSEIQGSAALDGGFVGRISTLARTRTHLYDNAGLRRLLERSLPSSFDALDIPFQCVAAHVETASERWFSSGPLPDAVLASSAVPGILPPVVIDGGHYFDGGIVNSIPVSRAGALGARRIYVLHVGRLDRPLEPPRWPWEVALVAFEIARRHRFVGDLAALPEEIDVHVLPTGQLDPPRYTSLSQYRYRDLSAARGRIARAREATARYLEEHDLGTAP
jgi:NTE family protein